jgi:hypothetical protein
MRITFRHKLSWLCNFPPKLSTWKFQKGSPILRKTVTNGTNASCADRACKGDRGSAIALLLREKAGPYLLGALHDAR